MKSRLQLAALQQAGKLEGHQTYSAASRKGIKLAAWQAGGALNLQHGKQKGNQTCSTASRRGIKLTVQQSGGMWTFETSAPPIACGNRKEAAWEELLKMSRYGTKHREVLSRAQENEKN